MGLYQKLDWWSIDEGLQNIIDYYDKGNEKYSQYWDFYSEQLNELGGIAADMWEELHYQIKERLWLRYNLPYKDLKFYQEDEAGDHTAISWWNTTACMLDDTDMATLLENENPYFMGELETEKQKRIRAFERLTKKQQLVLYTEVIGFVTRYLELLAAFETVRSVIQELEYHSSFLKTGNTLIAPKETYL